LFYFQQVTLLIIDTQMTDAQEGGDVEIKVDSLELPAPNVEMSIRTTTSKGCRYLTILGSPYDLEKVSILSP
jgi:hypothetical protein